MKILIVGQGAREHAMAWKASQSSLVEAVYLAPGNAGTQGEPKVQNINIKSEDIDDLLAFAKQHQIDMTLVGPEVPLVKGMVDIFQTEGLLCFGPTQSAAEIEGSKIFSKNFMNKYSIPTAEFQEFSDFAKAKSYIQKQVFPLVIKADGLAAGKGVVVAKTQEQAIETLENFMIKKILGAAGEKVIIEQFLSGTEVSYMIITDGYTYKPLASSQDYKRLQDQNQGPNTGGMGAISPSPLFSPALEKEVLETIIEPTLKGMQTEGRPFKGFLYAGLMICDQKPFVLEYNCRLGDPETQVLLPRLQTDFIALIQACLAGNLHHMSLRWDSRSALCAVLAAPGYPDEPKKGILIDKIPMLNELAPEVKIFHAGTERQHDSYVTSGGRVLCISAIGHSFREARQLCFQSLNAIHFEGMQYRKDIGLI